MRIEECLQYVLLNEQYVSLPNIGSFVREKHPSHINSRQEVTPPQYSISFNEERTFDDKALQTYLLQHSTLSREEVECIMQKWLRLLQQNLDKGIPVHFQGIGVLKKEGAHFILCSDSSKLNLTASAFANILLPKAKGISKRKSRRKSIIVVAAISIATLSVGLLFTYWLVSPHKPVRIEPSITPPAEQNSDTLTRDSVLAQLTSVDSAIVNKETQQILDSTHRQVNALRVETSPSSKKRFVYYIVAGSFSSIENANKLKNELSKKGYRPDVKEISSMYRVTLGKFYEKKSGIKEMNKRRKELNNDSYWLIETVESQE